MGKFIDLTGQKFGKLTVIKRVENDKFKNVMWLCRCECGNIKKIRGFQVKKSKSCGCLTRFKTKHALTNHPIFNLWHSMKDRCYGDDPQHKKYYKDRGIIVCDDWRDDFKAFYDWAITNGWEKGLQIDRIDNDGNYEPNNCRFVTPRQNALNKRRLNSRNTSGYEGVTWDKSRDKWLASIQIHGNTKTIGRFINKLDAVQARNNFILKNRLENDYKIQELS